jgi:hypothetical protein
MWENETVVLVTSLKKRLLEGKDKVRFGKISLDNGIPGFIKSIFENQVQVFLDNESPLTIRSTKHFDFQTKDIENLKDRLLKVFREAASFHEEEVEKILRDALIIRLNYIIKPVDTMRRLLFEKRDTIQLKDMEIELRGFSPILPYAVRILDECQNKGIPSLNTTEYGKIITDIIDKIMEKDPVKVVLHDFSVLKEFLSETKGEEFSRIEGTVLQEFLADRNLWGFRRALVVEMKLGREDFAASDLEVTLKRYLELKDEFSNNPPDITQTEIPIIENKPEKSEEKEQFNEVSVPPAESILQEAELDFGEVFFETDDLAKKTESEESVPLMEEKSKSARPMRIIRREQKENEDAEEKNNPPEMTKKDTIAADYKNREGLKTYIDDKTDKIFLKKLFNGDGESYEQLLKKLDDAESWRVAKILIDNELFKRDIDPFSREAIKLVDLVYSRYYPEEGVGGT